MSEIDTLFEAARLKGAASFGAWMRRVERPIRAALWPFRLAVDVEGVVQETLLRMWVLSQDRTRTLEGENGSLRFALGVARNLARAEARRLGREERVAPGDLPDVPVEPAPIESPTLRAAVEACMQRLRGTLAVALRLRIATLGDAGEANACRALGMRRNTFLQNVVRARRQIAECLRRKGASLTEVRS